MDEKKNEIILFENQGVILLYIFRFYDKNLMNILDIV